MGSGHVSRAWATGSPRSQPSGHDAEHFLALSCLTVLDSPSWTETAHDVSRVLDALARHPGRMGFWQRTTLAAGMSATQRDHRLHAVDAFLDLVPSGRILAGVASVMARYAEAWPANRWAETRIRRPRSGPGSTGRRAAHRAASTATHGPPRIEQAARSAARRDAAPGMAGHRPRTRPMARSAERIFCRCEDGTTAAWVGCGRGNHGGRAVYTYVRPSALTFAEGRADLLLATSGGRTAAGPRSTPSSSTASSAIPSRLPPPCWPWPRSPAPASTRRPACSPRSSAQPTPWSPATVTGCGSSFSACCGVYARYDALPGSLDGNVIDTGTTNVDFNPPMRDALARIGGLEPLHLQVGEDVVVRTLDASVTEKKVPLPERWLKGSPRSSLASRRSHPCSKSPHRKHGASSAAYPAPVAASRCGSCQPVGACASRRDQLQRAFRSRASTGSSR